MFKSVRRDVEVSMNIHWKPNHQMRPIGTYVLITAGIGKKALSRRIFRLVSLSRSRRLVRFHASSSSGTEAKLMMPAPSPRLQSLLPVSSDSFIGSGACKPGTFKIWQILGHDLGTAAPGAMSQASQAFGKFEHACNQNALLAPQLHHNCTCKHLQNVRHATSWCIRSSCPERPFSWHQAMAPWKPGCGGGGGGLWLLSLCPLCFAVFPPLLPPRPPPPQHAMKSPAPP